MKKSRLSLLVAFCLVFQVYLKDVNAASSFIINQAAGPYDKNADEEVLATVLFTQIDTKESVICWIVDNPGPFALWMKDPDNTVYRLFYNKNLGAITSNSYTLTIQCQGTKGGSSQNTITLNYGSAPSFSTASQSGTVNADTATVNTVVGTASATDADKDVLAYSMTSSSPYASYFSVNPQSGVVTLVKDPRGINASSVALTLAAWDGSNTATQSWTIDIKPQNVAPTISTVGKSTITVGEDALGGTVVTEIKATDGGTTVTPACRVTSPSAEASKFSFDASTGRLTLVGDGTLDYVTTKQYLVRCTASDGFLTSTVTLTVSVLDVNEGPQFDKARYTCTLYESAAGESKCKLGMSIKDPEGDAFTAFLESSKVSDSFAFDSKTYELTFSGNYDVDIRSRVSSAVLKIMAQDARQASTTADVEVTIVDVNDNAPKFVTTYGAVINEGDTVRKLMTLTATDADITSPNNDVTYTLTGCTPGGCGAYFSVVGNEVHYYNTMDTIKSDTAFTLTVTATDGGDPPNSDTTQIMVNYYMSTTSTTTTTPATTTTTPTTTTTQATTTPYNFFAHSENVAIFAMLMMLLLGGLLAAILACCGCCSGGRSGGWMCDCFRSRAVTPPRVHHTEEVVEHVKTVEEYVDDDYFRTSEVKKPANSDYKDPFWKDGDAFETGRYKEVETYRSSRTIPDRSVVLTPSDLTLDRY